MSNHNLKTSNQNKHLSEDQILGYHKGRMKSAEMHQLEQHLLECELCRDAMEGYELLHAHQAAEALSELKGELSKKLNTENDQRSFFWPLSVAASLLLVLSFATYFFVNQANKEDDKNIAKQEEIQPSVQPSAPPTKLSAPPASNNVAKNDLQETEIKTNNSEKQVAKVTQQDISLKEPIALKEAESEIEISEPAFNEIIEEQKPTINTSTIAAADKKKEAVSARRFNVDEAKSSYSPTASIKGKVVGEDGLPLPGVNVMVKGSTTGTVTDLEGNYELVVPSQNAILVFSFIGYNANEVEVKDLSKPLNTQLNPDMAALSEVVVTGYSTEGISKSGNGKVFIAKPEGGIKAFKEYIKENTNYSEEARTRKIEGKVVVEFYVEADGRLSNFRIKKSLGHGLDEEAIRLVKDGPKWQPGTYNNHPIREQVEVKIPFNIK